MSRSKPPLPRTPTRRAGKNRTRLFLGLGGALILITIAAIVLTPDQPVAANEYGVVTITGDSLFPFSGQTSGDPAVGAPAPEISGFDFEGRPISVNNDGRPKLVLFLAHWCPHCQREVPAIEQYLVDNEFPEGVDVYSVATASSPTRPNWPPSSWLTEEGWSLPVLVDDEQNSAFRGFGQGDFPYFVFIDRQGNVALRLIGQQQPGLLASLMESLASGS